MSGSRTPRPRRPRRTRFLLAGAALCALAPTTTGCSSGGPAAADTTTAPADVLAVADSSADDLQTAYEHAVRDVLPSVVQITTREDLGSGVVYDTKGHIVTNAHVIGDASSFQVQLATGGKPLAAELVSSFPANDLAVIRLSDPPGGLKPAAFADSGRAAVGQIVLAMGNPLGLSSSVTQGIVSATGRTVSESGSGGGTSGPTIPDMVQTSAAINPGNSGGALVGLDEKVIGIPTLAAVDPQFGSSAAPGIGFAIPSATVKRIADQIIKNGRVTDSGRAALGVTVRGVVGKDFQPAGTAIVQLMKGGAAAKAGLRAGDVITGVGDAQITTAQSLTEALAPYKPGERVTVTYQRDGRAKTVEVTLGAL
jgi:S1-C subfamily serine protease